MTDNHGFEIVRTATATDLGFLRVDISTVRTPTGEDKPTAAVRELAEETGYVAHDLLHLTDLKTAVGFTNELITIYLAPSVTPGEAHPVGAEEREARVFTIPFTQAVEEVGRGSISDAKTVAGILLAERLRGPT